MEKQNSKKEIESIINFYSLFYKNFFKLLVVIIPFAISTVVVVMADKERSYDYEYESHNALHQEVEDVWLEERDWAYFGNNVAVNTDIEISGVDVETLRWFAAKNEGEVHLEEAIAKVDDLYLPDSVVLSEEDIQFIKSFDQNDYSPEELDQIITEIFLDNNELKNVQTNNNNLQKFAVEEFDGEMKEYFGIWCIFGNRATDVFCKRNIDNFLENFYRYDLTNDISWFEEIFERLVSKGYDERVCKWLKNNLYYWFDVAPELVGFFSSCSSKMWEEYEFLKEYEQLIKEEVNQTYSSNVYSYEWLNYYKLLTMQKDISNNPDSTTRISRYFSFLERMLDSDKLDWIYKDIVYFYNNQLLEQYLREEWNMDNFEDDLRTFNSWGWGIGDTRLRDFEWLENTISNQELIDYQEEEDSDDRPDRERDTLEQDFENYISQIEELTVRNWEVDQDQRLGRVEGALNYEIMWNERSLRTQIMFEEDWTGFYVKDIRFGVRALNQNVENILGEGEPDMDDIKERTKAFLRDRQRRRESATQTLCDVMEWNLENISDSSIEECNEEELEVSREDFVYTFDIEENEIVSAEVPTDNLQSQVDTELEDEGMWWETAVRFVASIVNTQLDLGEDEQDYNVSDVNTINRRFDDFLETNANVVDHIDWGNYEVEFVMEDDGEEYDFVGEFDVDDNYRLTNLRLFTEKNDEWEYEEIFEISDYEQNMLSNNEAEFNRFRIDTIDYIEEKDEEAVSNYFEYLEEED